MTPLPPTAPILDHLAALDAAGLEIVPGSLVLVRDPLRLRQWVAMVGVRERAEKQEEMETEK